MVLIKGDVQRGVKTAQIFEERIRKKTMSESMEGGFANRGCNRHNHHESHPPFPIKNFNQFPRIDILLQY